MKHILPLMPTTGQCYSLLLVISFLLLTVTSFAQQRPARQASAPGNIMRVTGHNNLSKVTKEYDKQTAAAAGAKPVQVGDNALLRAMYEKELLKDPRTGRIPDDIRQRELLFARKNLNKVRGTQEFQRVAGQAALSPWKARGPYNVGGRTRAVALDMDNEQVILAGGVSGGMWRSEDGGQTWRKTTGTNEIQSVTAIAQDPRPGHRHTWYYATGERLGNSASDAGAFFGGNGIYKSVDGGRSWQVLPVTADNRPQSNTPFDIVFNLAIHPATGHLYVASWRGVLRSTDGGASFTTVLETGVDVASDVIATPAGVLYAAIASAGNPNRGILRSTDGTTWRNITPANFPATFGRTVLAYTPSDENIIYAYAQILTSASAYLWRYTYNPADTSAVHGAWANLSANLPTIGGNVGSLNTQGGYNMVIKVHPTNPNAVFIGATNLYRSTTGFTTKAGQSSWIGGYSPANDVSIYTNQHPDQHGLLFFPSNPNKALSATDGGLHLTDSILGVAPGIEPVTWTSLNNGYLTTQPYTVSFDPLTQSETLISGFQDNGTWFTASGAPNTPWSQPYGGDGSYNALADSGRTRYVSSQTGNIYRFNYTSGTAPGEDYISFSRVTPAGGSGFLFITPFVLDRLNDNVMYLAVNNRVWRNDDLDALPLFSVAPTSVNWVSLAGSEVPAGQYVSALDISRMPANRLYYGTNAGGIYRIDNANLGDQPAVNISEGKGLPAGYVVNITIDPANADRVFAVFSNYNIRSVFYTANGGQTWTDISGNLEENPDGTGSGPSIRWLAIEGNSDRYYLGTSTGLYATTTLNGNATTWVQQDTTGIGNVVVPMVKTRADGFVAVASHGNGLYSAKFSVSPLPEPKLRIANPIDNFEVFVNSPRSIIDVSQVFEHTGGDSIALTLLNTNPAIVTATLQNKLLILEYKKDSIGRASIGLIATSGNESLSEPFTVAIRQLTPPLFQQTGLAQSSQPSQLFTDFGNALAQTADDFVVPAGQTWFIDSVYAQGAVNGQPVLNAVRMTIYADSAGRPGPVVYNSSFLSPASGISNPELSLRPDSAIRLTGGKYWLTVYPRLAYAGGNQWFWRTQALAFGSETLFKDDADLFGAGALDWTPTSTALQRDPMDAIFALFGSALNVPAPTPPDSLDAGYVTPVKFRLTWKDRSANEIAFVLQRSTDGRNFTHRTLIPANTTTYFDTDLFDPSRTYYYRVAAVGLSDTSAWSNIDSVAIIPIAPKALPAGHVTPKRFIARWEASPGAKYYLLDVSADNFNTFLSGYNARKVTGTQHTVNGTENKKQYQYRLRAVNAGGASGYSNVITVAKVKYLGLAAVCSDAPDTYRKWKITNPNPFDIEVVANVFGTSKLDTITAPPGVSYYITPALRTLNILVIFWDDDRGFTWLNARFSSGRRCVNGYVSEEVATLAEETTDSEQAYIVNVWPNPTTDAVRLLVSAVKAATYDVQIFSTNGQRVYEKREAPANQLLNIDLSRHPAGVYIVKVKQGNEVKTIKVVKQ